MKSEYNKINACRVGGSKNLVTVLSLGHQALTGVFPRSAEEKVTVGPMELVWSPDSGLLQLNHTYNASEMYGDNYGYRSGLNQSMVDHLSNKVAYLEKLNPLNEGDVVLDIGSNDCTTLNAYITPGIRRIGIDPTGRKFSEYYPADITLIPDFFSANAYQSIESRKVRIVTSIAMFYDLEAPIEFAKEIESILAEDGIWHFEQSYMPSMLRMNSYDTICHEHLEYYSLAVVKKILEKSGLRLIDVVMNSVNGGSFAVTATKISNISMKANTAVIDWLLGQENRMGLNTPRPYREFEERVFRHREDLTRLIRALNGDGKKVLGYGASTKGNVVLQFCGLTARDIPAIADVNPQKFGHVTPGSHIPIVSEDEAKAMKPDYYLVFPWHFKDTILRREKEYSKNGGRFIFPFPDIEIV
ncbi:class I SAM-dependent methyltransferase [Shewanella sp.]|uniref:class I SAM-dependent methyltransferase n=1 Tax=Shewanella sp. TaxID=50422 RepID=UPI0040488E8A